MLPTLPNLSDKKKQKSKAGAVQLRKTRKQMVGQSANPVTHNLRLGHEKPVWHITGETGNILRFRSEKLHAIVPPRLVENQ